MNVSRIALAALACAACTTSGELAGVDGGLDTTELSTLRFAPVADARVEQLNPGSNFGTAASLSSDLDPLMQSYLRFDVSGIGSQAIAGARLRLYVTNGTGNGPVVFATSSSWGETTITWNNKPATVGAVIDNRGSVAQGAWVEYDLGALVTGDGTYSVAVIPDSTDGFAADSREGSNRPELVLTIDVPDPAQPTAAVVADARVEQLNPGSNYGAATSLSSDLDPAMQSYLTFAVSGVGDQTVTGARLRLWVSNGTGNGPALFATSSSWSESTLTWNNKPAAAGAALADKGSVAQGAWVEYDLGGLVTGDGTYSVVLVPQTTDGFTADSREAANKPEVVVTVGTVPPPPPDGSFVFAAAGDHGASSSTSAVFDLVPALGAAFFLSLGDLSYGSLSPETVWCDYVKSHVGATYPFEIISGAHESNTTHGDGLIDNFVASNCLPNRLSGVQGTYAKEFYLDYPSGSPTTRFIMISPSLNFTYGGTYDYTRGSSHYNWTAAAIDDARARGIRWIVVGMHRNCITMGIKSCEIGKDVFNLLVEKKVDLILQGHDHNYQRSKQLALSGSCAGIQPGSYNAGCVADTGSDGLYTAGNGPVLVINGMGGIGTYALSTSDAEAPYFASSMTSSTYGLVKATVSPTRLDVQFVRGAGGSYTDSFSIVRP
jgi:hypothetical protein